MLCELLALCTLLLAGAPLGCTVSGCLHQPFWLDEAGRLYNRWVYLSAPLFKLEEVLQAISISQVDFPIGKGPGATLSLGYELISCLWESPVLAFSGYDQKNTYQRSQIHSAYCQTSRHSCFMYFIHCSSCLWWKGRSEFCSSV